MIRVEFVAVNHSPHLHWTADFAHLCAHGLEFRLAQGGNGPFAAVGKRDRPEEIVEEDAGEVGVVLRQGDDVRDLRHATAPAGADGGPLDALQRLEGNGILLLRGHRFPAPLSRHLGRIVPILRDEHQVRHAEPESALGRRDPRAAPVASAFVVKARPVGRDGEQPETVTNGVGHGLLGVGYERGQRQQSEQEGEGGFDPAG